ncbi:hypothetical protein [Desulfovibrio sp. TomC]|uniref:hypothetical protein n=1 Tax=Desulfovibrio sp. TomC TaxID=1562888 RepID=UPI00057304D9|nr:hypothetical protein [Desulfovibrio sp. TomC]KHK03950.1 hypothetical protein NY78_0392 [Desulfovibrio sp. TomC]
MRPSDVFLVVTGGLILLLATLLAGYPLADAGRRDARQSLEARLVAELGLTDLCLSTEARYTRHLSQADRFAAFQDHPRSLEHFPSGALLPPPRLLTAGSTESEP